MSNLVIPMLLSKAKFFTDAVFLFNEQDSPLEINGNLKRDAG